MQIRNPYCPPYINVLPQEDLALIVTIPCYNEPDIISSLQSLYDCDPIEPSIEVIVVINNGNQVTKEIKSQNQQSFAEASLWAEKHSTPKKKFFIRYFSDLPKKHAGVGLARKIAMDEAAHRFLLIDNLDGIIQCYDADATCQPNLLQAVIDGFRLNQTSSLGIYYEHPIEGDKYPQEIYKAIISYELHLRYYDNIQKFIGLPFAFQTIGSSMAVKVIEYIKQGGMNKRKAGEDFYFLQKFITIDQHSEIHNTKVIPSPRMSDRVPFGTGKAVNDIIEKKNESGYSSYNPQAFIELKILLDELPILYASIDIDIETNHWPLSLKSYFLEEENIVSVIKESKNNTSNFGSFQKRFYKWFNAFRLMKYLHYCENQNTICDIPITQGAYIFITKYLKEDVVKDNKEMLLFFRRRDQLLKFNK